MTIIYPPAQQRPIDLTSLVEVYRNLNVTHPQIPDELKTESAVYGCPIYSICQNGRVVGYSNNLVLENVRVRIYEAGQRKAKETQRKNVHAYFVGKLAPRVNGACKASGGFPINPYRPKRGDTCFTYRVNAFVAEVGERQDIDSPFWYAAAVKLSPMRVGSDLEAMVYSPRETVAPDFS